MAERTLLIGKIDDLCHYAGQRISSLVQKEGVILGGATGRTQFGVYSALRDGGADFSDTKIFFLDEYFGADVYRRYALRELVEKFQDKRNAFKEENIWVPKGIYMHSGKAIGQKDLEKELKKHTGDFVWKGPELHISEDCKSRMLSGIRDGLEQQEKSIPKIGLQILGLGIEGHIAFNEVGTCDLCGLHITKLSESTLRQNADDFTGEPFRYAVTQGIRNVMGSDRLFLIVFGARKADALNEMFFGCCPASVLKWHPDITILADIEAAAALDRKAIEGAGWKVADI